MLDGLPLLLTLPAQEKKRGTDKGELKFLVASLGTPSPTESPTSNRLLLPTAAVDT